MQLAVCQICKDPVWSYICPDCLSKDISKWLPRKLSAEFRKFSRFFLEIFNSVESNRTILPCLKCLSKKEVTVCPFCYIAEAFHWLEEKDRKLARALFMMLPVDSDWTVDKNSGCVWVDGIKPISYSERTVSEGICEECGEYSEEAELWEGKWVCSE
ncbi:MAG: hypothetical protein QW286_00770, partial [Candidatus Aenigmatarchaeota archaeon]